MKRTLVLILLSQFLLANYALLGQGLSTDQIDSIVNKSMEMMSQVGIAVVVVQDGKIVHSKGYGITSIKSKKIVDENTLFSIGSNTKSFTAAALAILVDEGKLNWDDKVVEHIPEFKMYDSYVTANFNIIDLLSHRSGLGLGAGDLLFWPGGTNSTIDDILNCFQYLKPVSAFRTKFDYDNLLYMVAGEVVARVSGMSWEEFVQVRIMIPLGMNQSTFMKEISKDKNNTARPHSSANDKLKEIAPFDDKQGLMSSTGSIYSSVNDMSNWLLMHLNKGRYGNELSEQLISKKNLTEMWKPQTNISFNANPRSPYKSHFEAYGLGWAISDKNGYVHIGHNGGTAGMLSSMLLIPELNVGVVVLTNSNPGGFSYETIKSEIRDAYIGVKIKDRLGRVEKKIKKNESKADSVLTATWNNAYNSKTDQLDFNNYIGNYQDNWFGDVEISLKEGKLWFQSIKSPKLNGEMFYYKATTFAIKMEFTDSPCDAFAIFNFDENGNAINLKMKGISPNIDFSFDYQDLDLNRIDK